MENRMDSNHKQVFEDLYNKFGQMGKAFPTHLVFMCKTLPHTWCSCVRDISIPGVHDSIVEPPPPTLVCLIEI